jgi:hypothetical protein
MLGLAGAGVVYSVYTLATHPDRYVYTLATLYTHPIHSILILFSLYS